MNDARFTEARQAYDAGDFRTAAKLFIASAGDVTDGNGAAFHLAGNAQMRLRRYNDAIASYQRALADPIYDKRGAVLVNLAQAQGAVGDYADAISSFEAALADPGYKTPHKALQGLASALLEVGRIEDAASAYRKAALDEHNPDPGKALVNLGLCFMALGRPADAAEAYKAALGFDDYEGRGKALANLGQAQHAMGRNADAVKSFEKAVNLHGYALSSAALRDYDAALTAITPPRQVEGWSTGEMPAVSEVPSDVRGWDAGELEALVEEDEEPAPVAYSAAAAATPIDFDSLGPGAGVIDDEREVSAFLERTDEEMRDRDREVRREARLVRRESRNPWKIVAIVALVIAAVTIPLVLIYQSGYGWPTQSGTVGGLLDARSSGKAVEGYWIAVPQKDLAKEMAKIPPLKSYTIDSVDRSSQTSTVTVTVTPQKGAPLRYTISLEREGAGWKVTGVENDWRATGSP